MGGLGKIVSDRPLAVIIVVLLVSGIFGYYATQMNMSADLKTFLPDDEVAKADERITEQFGDKDIMEIILISNNTLSKESMEDMLRIEMALEDNEAVRKNLTDSDKPWNSVMSPADVVVMGNITLDFEKEVINLLDEMRENMSGMNLSVMVVPLNVMISVMEDYGDIYHNATQIRDDAKVIVLMMFRMPGEGGEMDENLTSLMENITSALMYGENFEVKSKFLTMLTPPAINTTGNESMENPLMDFFFQDMRSGMSIGEKEVSIRYFLQTQNFTEISTNYTNTSLTEGIEGNENMINALNYANYSITIGDNNTAIGIMDSLIENLSHRIKGMEYLLPVYEDYNRSLSKFLYDMNSNALTPEDVRSVMENTSRMMNYTDGDFLQMLRIFNSTLNEWNRFSHIYYDVATQANTTLQMCSGFLETYDGSVKLNSTLSYIRSMINVDSVRNTTGMITNVIKNLEYSTQSMEEQRAMIEDIMASFESTYYLWFKTVLMDLDYILRYSIIAPQAINVFNFITGMMNSPGGGAGGMGEFQVFYVLKHAFDSSVADMYKYKIQGMYLKEMSLANYMAGFEFNMSMEKPSLNPPNFDLSAKDKMEILENMSQEDILKTINDIENYDDSKLNEAINLTVPVVNNVTRDMENVTATMEKLIDRMEFVYETTGDENVSSGIEMYSNMSEEIKNATSSLSEFGENVRYLTGFSYMMSQFSTQFRNMFSKDYNGERAKASLIIVMLNNTHLPGESSTEHSDRMEKVETLVENVAKSVKVNGEVRVMGTYLISKATEKTANETRDILLPTAMILVLVILLITFRSLLDTFLGLLGLGMVIIWAYGFGVLMNYSFNQISTTVAVLLVGLGIDYAIHSILRYREEVRKGLSVRDAMREMITHLGMGLILATITTIVAFLSNLSSPIPPIQSFGVMNAVGIFGAFVIFTTFVPAVKILIDERLDRKGKLKIRRERKEGSGISALNKFMALGAVGAERHRYSVLLIVIIITGMSVYAGANVNTTFDLKDFLPSNLEVSDTITFMMDNFNTSGINDNYILIEGNITSTETIKAVADTVNNIKDDEYVDGSQIKSITTFIEEWKEKNSTFSRMVAENDTDGDGLPDKNITAIYDWLYLNGDGKEILHRNNGTYDSMLIVIRSTASTDDENRILTEEVEKDIKPLKDAGLKATLTGANILTFHILDMLTGSQWNSLMITIIVSLVVLTAIFYYEARSYILGTITTLPVIIALLWLLGTMYLLDIGFNVVTVTITSLTIGLGITYAIHISHRFVEEMKKKEDVENAIRKTVMNTGSSIFGAAATTMAGFGTLILSSMPPIRQFGLIAALSILYSFVLSVFILPSFLYVWAERRERKIITIENADGYRKISMALLIIGGGIYLSAFFLRWYGWRIISYPPSIVPAVIGVVTVVAALEMFQRSNGNI